MSAARRDRPAGGRGRGGGCPQRHRISGSALPHAHQPVRQPARAVRLPDQPVPRLFDRLHLLLRALHARVHGARRLARLRAQDLREAGRRRRAAAGPAAPRSARQVDRDRYRDRPLSARRTRISSHPLAPRTLRRPPGLLAFDHHEERSGDPRPRSARPKSASETTCRSTSRSPRRATLWPAAPSPGRRVRTGAWPRSQRSPPRACGWGSS